MENNSSVHKFVKDQLSVWPMAAANFRALKNVEIRKMDINGLHVRLQHNPSRIRSSAAKVDSASLKARKCFLCQENRPEEQLSLLFEGRKGRKYDILINPYPIFPEHLVIARKTHSPQSIWKRVVDMTDIARHFPDFTVFYNGPKCGASAPDHMHFQACPRGMMPLEEEVDRLLANGAEGLDYLTFEQDADLFHFSSFTKGIFVLRARTSKSFAKLFYRLLDCLPEKEGESEPMFNLIAWYSVRPTERVSGISHGRFGEYRAILLARDRHRSHHYFSDGPDHLTMSPGCADMAGLFIVPQADDFAKLSPEMIAEMLSEVSVSQEAEDRIIWKLTRSQPELQVGIMSGKEIEFEIISDGAGRQKVSWENGRISYNGTLYDELLFDARTMSTMFAEPTFILYGVTIGVDFHWEQKMTQRFAGSLKFIVEGDNVVAVNLIGVEDYLVSVISSEMRASAPPEFLKAHSVISRSWVMRQIAMRRADSSAKPADIDIIENGVRHIVKWFDSNDHKAFDVCADDHCQRYQGLITAVGDNVRRAVDETWGQVLLYDGKLCDARFSKCCGGMMEKFSTCWSDEDFPYLLALPDTREDGSVQDLTDEETAEKWILTEPDAYCNTADRRILSAVLNDYDLETSDFFRWRVSYTRRELSDIIIRRSGQDIGLLKSLRPLKRGPSGRIMELLIEGDKSSIVVAKELIIRRFLSDSHLRSSAFVVKTEPGATYEADIITLLGAGWGHGVGLCQIGAAVMSSEGADYKAILSHYYPGAVLGECPINDEHYE
ncbi:MAG: DUF4922 domain-containing protein [Candidatus Cryptobacteroides sp.]